MFGIYDCMGPANEKLYKYSDHIQEDKVFTSVADRPRRCFLYAMCLDFNSLNESSLLAGMMLACNPESTLNLIWAYKFLNNTSILSCCNPSRFIALYTLLPFWLLSDAFISLRFPGHI